MTEKTVEKTFDFEIKHQETYSRLELILRTLFGFVYIGIPHFFLLFFVSIAGAVVRFIAFWIILFTGKYPQSMFDFTLNIMRWSTRVSARLTNLADGYPAFGLKAQDDAIVFDIKNPAKISRLLVIMRLLFGFIYVYIPHFFVLYFRLIAAGIIQFIAFWIVLFTGKYPKGMFDFVVGTYRWMNRVSAYMSFMTDEYPKFSGKA